MPKGLEDIEDGLHQLMAPGALQPGWTLTVHDNFATNCMVVRLVAPNGWAEEMCLAEEELADHADGLSATLFRWINARAGVQVKPRQVRGAFQPQPKEVVKEIEPGDRPNRQIELE